ncbi:hypothetical protein M758_12G116300 [Ceratodon purpureus]|nr:hypothetical protein M758_12G116300 [Ceratodon purpureus]
MQTRSNPWKILRGARLSDLPITPDEGILEECSRTELLLLQLTHATPELMSLRGLSTENLVNMEAVKLNPIRMRHLNDGNPQARIHVTPSHDPLCHMVTHLASSRRHNPPST